MLLFADMIPDTIKLKVNSESLELKNDLWSVLTKAGVLYLQRGSSLKKISKLRIACSLVSTLCKYIYI